MSEQSGHLTDTIAAIATPPGTGGVGIVRISGPDVPRIAKVLTGALPEPRLAELASARRADGSLVDTGIALYFPAPHSFTGEHVLEFQGHGGMHVMQQLLEAVIEQGARMARPGEFSERAFLNDKLDLVQAEAIADLIESATDAAARAAQRSLQGQFSEKIQKLQHSLTELRVFVEAAIDFPDEEIDFLAESDVVGKARNIEKSIAELLLEARQGRLLRDGFVLAIIGPPNAGKSSLLNALSGQDSAIVTAIPGTTRDVLREQIDLDGIPVHVADTAGIRETEDQIEAEGVRRARQTLVSADIVILLEDISDQSSRASDLQDEIPPGTPFVQVLNKCDLKVQGNQRPPGSGEFLEISALTGQGIDGLKARLRELVGASDSVEGSFSARQRHVDALKNARQSVAAAYAVLQETAAGELMAEELRQAQQSLGEITGEMLADDLLGEIFSSFCIGK